MFRSIGKGHQSAEFEKIVDEHTVMIKRLYKYVTTIEIYHKIDIWGDISRRKGDSHGEKTKSETSSFRNGRSDGRG